MTQKTNSFEKFWKELKRRKVVHVITVYAAIAFVVLQLVDMVSQPLHFPEWTQGFIIVLLCIGFVISVFVSWIYDITQGGVKKTKPVSEVKDIGIKKLAVSRGWKISTYVSGAIVIALVAFNFISKRSLNKDILKLEKSIAVLPFINDSPDTTNTYFINGLMDKITTNLQMIKELRVVSRTSVEQYRNRTKSIPEIANELDVNYIVEGNGQKYGSSFSVDVKLIKAKGKETHLWSKPYEQEINEVKDYIKVQSQIAQAVAAELKAVITPEEKQLIEKTPTANLTALDFYQRGREEYTKYLIDNNRAALKKAENFFHIALKYDSTFAQAYSGLARVYWSKYYFKEYFSPSFLDSVLVYANTALTFDDQLAEAYFVRGEYYEQKGFTKQAIEEFDKTIEFNPNDWMAYYGKGNLYLHDDLLTAIENLQKAGSLNHGSELPLILGRIGESLLYAGFTEKAKDYLVAVFKLVGAKTQYLWYLAEIEYCQSNYEKALEYLRAGYSLDSTDVMILSDLGYCYSFTGQFKESVKYYKKYVERVETLGQFDLQGTQRIGYAFWKNGDKKKAEYYFDKQIEYCKNSIQNSRPYALSKYAYYDLAGVYAFRGNKEKAYENLRIFNQRQRISFVILIIMKNDLLFNSIRNEPEFQQIERDMEAKYQAEHERVRKWMEEQGQL